MGSSKAVRLYGETAPVRRGGRSLTALQPQSLKALQPYTYRFLNTWSCGPSPFLVPPGSRAAPQRQTLEQISRPSDGDVEEQRRVIGGHRDVRHRRQQANGPAPAEGGRNSLRRAFAPSSAADTRHWRGRSRRQTRRKASGPRRDGGSAPCRLETPRRALPNQHQTGAREGRSCAGRHDGHRTTP